FRACGKTDPGSARAPGKNSKRDRASESQFATFATHPHRNSHRANAGCNQSRADRARPFTRSSAADEEGLGPIGGENRGGVGGLQKMAPERSTPPLRRRFSSRRGKVQKEIALRAGVGFADGRNLETGKGRSGTNRNRNLRNGVAALQKIFPERRST